MLLIAVNVAPVKLFFLELMSLSKQISQMKQTPFFLKAASPKVRTKPTKFIFSSVPQIKLSL